MKSENIRNQILYIGAGLVIFRLAIGFYNNSGSLRRQNAGLKLGLAIKC